MPPPPSGLDFSPILTHYLFLFTTVTSILAWFIAFISQAIATSQLGRASVGVLWFAIFLQFALIAGVIYTLASDSIAMHRMQISVFGAIAIVFAVMGVDMGIFSGVASLDAMAAGWLILAIVDILWVLYFTSEEDSLALHVFNSLGTGGLTPPSRRRRQRTQSTMNNMGGIGGGNGVGYTNNYSSGGGIGSHDMPYTNAKMGSPVQSGGMGSGIGAPIRSQNSFNSGDAGRSMGNNSMTHIPHSNGPPSLTGGDNIGGGGLSSPLMASGGNAGSQASVGQSEHEYSKKAKALYAYTASPDDPNEISFSKGETLDIMDTQGKWWQARKADGTTGIAPSNYLQVI